MTCDSAGLFCAAAAVLLIISFVTCGTAHADDSLTATCTKGDDAAGPPASGDSLVQLATAHGRYPESVAATGVMPRVATRRESTMRPQKHLAGVPVYNYHLVDQTGSVISGLQKELWLPPASKGPVKPELFREEALNLGAGVPNLPSIAPVPQQGPTGAFESENLRVTLTAKEPAPTAGAELPSAPVACEDTLTTLTFEGVPHKDCPSLISATNRNGVNWWCNTQENNFKMCQLTCAKCRRQVKGETSSGSLPELQPSTVPDTTSPAAPADHGHSADCPVQHIWCEPLRHCIWENHVCSKEAAAWRAEQRDWFLGLPGNYTNAQVAESCIDLPGNASCTYLGHPDEHGVPFLMVHANEDELEEILRRHPDSDFVEPDAPMYVG